MLCKIPEERRPVFILTQTLSMNMLQTKLSVISIATWTDGEGKGDPQETLKHLPICILCIRPPMGKGKAIPVRALRANGG
jgi:hypothetical protein